MFATKKQKEALKNDYLGKVDEDFSENDAEILFDIIANIDCMPKFLNDNFDLDGVLTG